jgi:hypothetical protein
MRDNKGKQAGGRTHRLITLAVGGIGLIVALAAVVLAAAPHPPTPLQPGVPRRVTVQAAQGWQDTGLLLPADRPVRVTYVAGSWTENQHDWPPHDGANATQDYICAAVLPAAQCVEPIPDAPQGLLIGRAGRALLKIGNDLTFYAETTDPLTLRMNDGDDGLYDNAGAITVEVVALPR